MRLLRITTLLSILGTSAAVAACSTSIGGEDEDTETSTSALNSYQQRDFPNAAGVSSNLSTNGVIDTNNEFFKSLGTNGRACVTCHQPGFGFSITPKFLQDLFEKCEKADEDAHRRGRRHGNDDDCRRHGVNATACAVFRTNDGSNSPNVDVSTKAKRKSAYSMLLSKGLIRIEQTLRADAEFDVIAVDDPYGYATTSRFSFFRRPLPSTNLKHAAEGAVMWDGRETDVDDRSLPQLDPAGIGLPQLIGDIFNPEPVFNVLARQADNATLGHAQAAAPLTEEQKASIVNFELALFSAQSVAKGAGSLTAAGGNGGPVALSQQPFIYLDNTSGLVPFDSNVFTIYNAWKTANNPHRKSIARGQEIFNNKKGPGIQLPGFNPNVTCSECHSARNIGDVSAGAVQPFPLVSAAEFRTPDMPLYTLRCNPLGAARGACTEGQTTQSTDPGRGTVSGRWADINVFKAPALRALATRAPYFHNGSAATLDDVIDRYVQVLGFTFTQQERTDLINFLNSL